MTTETWELVSNESNLADTTIRSFTHRLEVTGGYIYRTVVQVILHDRIALSVSTVFKPGA